MKSIEQMLTLHSYQGCSDVRDRCYCAWVLFLSVFQLYSIWRLLQLSVRLFLKNKRKIHLFKNICFPYSFSLSWFIWRHDHLTWNWRVRLGHRDSRVSTPIPLLWRSKSFDCSSLYCMFSHRLWRDSVPLNGSQWMALCQTWVTFFFASGFLQIISFENLA